LSRELLQHLDSFEKHSITRTELALNAVSEDEAQTQAFIETSGAICAPGGELDTRCEALSSELVQAQSARAALQEYDDLRGLIREEPPRGLSQARVDDLRHQQQTVEEETAAISQRYDLRAKQLQLLLFALAQLEEDLEVEDDVPVAEDGMKD
jgi:hypothetical protein